MFSRNLIQHNSLLNFFTLPCCLTAISDPFCCCTTTEKLGLPFVPTYLEQSMRMGGDGVGLKRRELAGRPGTWGGLWLWLGQAALAAASIAVMVTFLSCFRGFFLGGVPSTSLLICERLIV